MYLCSVFSEQSAQTWEAWNRKRPMVAEPKKACAVRMVWSFSPLNIFVKEPCA